MSQVMYISGSMFPVFITIKHCLIPLQVSMNVSGKLGIIHYCPMNHLVQQATYELLSQPTTQVLVIGICELCLHYNCVLHVVV